MMGICYDPDLDQMSLILEPFDFTLNHYLHQMVRNSMNQLNFLINFHFSLYFRTKS